MVAHTSQLHDVPADWSDEAAVMVETHGLRVHAALVGAPALAAAGPDAVAVILGAGTLGLVTLAALKAYGPPCRVVVAAKHAGQKRVARSLGADVVCDPGDVRRTVRRAVGTLAVGTGDPVRLTGGADVFYDCVGSADSITDALDTTRPRGTVVLVGWPGASRST